MRDIIEPMRERLCEKRIARIDATTHADKAERCAASRWSTKVGMWDLVPGDTEHAQVLLDALQLEEV